MGSSVQIDKDLSYGFGDGHQISTGFGTDPGFHFAHGKNITINSVGTPMEFQMGWGEDLDLNGTSHSYLFGRGTATTPLSLNQPDAFAIGFGTASPNFIVSGFAGGVFTGINRITPAGLGGTTLVGGTAATGDEELSINGQVLATAYYENSDRRWKTEIERLSEPLRIVSALNGYRYAFRNEEFPEMNFEEAPTYGLLAQELEEVYPHAVRYTHEGYRVVNYSSLSALFVEALKAQQVELEAADARTEELTAQLAAQQEVIAQMQARLAALEAGDSPQPESRTSEEPAKEEGAARLYHAEPNPFSQQTRIRYQLPREASAAQLQIYDVEGRLMLSRELEAGGRGAVVIEAGELRPGSYVCSLVVDGRPVDRMKLMRQSGY